jgi:hypothetical protein
MDAHLAAVAYFTIGEVKSANDAVFGIVIPAEAGIQLHVSKSLAGLRPTPG